jgi:sugar O-acyltransferase (sialic acid O-acetyltransferase NeuD family)
MKTDVILVGGFHEMIELCDECGLNVVGIIDNVLVGSYYGVQILGTDKDAERLYPAYSRCKVVITPDSPNVREELVRRYKAIGYEFATVISPYAHVSKYAKIGEGTVIQAGVNISAAVEIENFVKLNTNANIMHDCFIGSYSTIAPDAVVLGRVIIDPFVYIGANSTVLPSVHIEERSIVGAGAVVTKSVSLGSVVKGVPAK